MQNLFQRSIMKYEMSIIPRYAFIFYFATLFFTNLSPLYSFKKKVKTTKLKNKN